VSRPESPDLHAVEFDAFVERLASSNDPSTRESATVAPAASETIESRPTPGGAPPISPGNHGEPFFVPLPAVEFSTDAPTVSPSVTTRAQPVQSTRRETGTSENVFDIFGFKVRRVYLGLLAAALLVFAWAMEQKLHPPITPEEQRQDDLEHDRWWKFGPPSRIR
jgi:hypothetical protein